MDRRLTSSRLWAFVLLAVILCAPNALGDQVEVLRDPWGVPHVFSDTDAGAFYGLGYATAEDRAFQMTYSLRTIQGRLSEAVTRRRLGYYETLDNFPSLDPDGAVATPPLDVIDGGAIGCQTAQSYTQWAPMHDPDLAQSILPIGQAERPGAASRTSTLELWGQGRLHPAPLSRAKVEALGVTVTLEREWP